MTHIHIPTPAEPVCDFCCAKPVKWSYPARDFSHTTEIPALGRITLNSHEEWAACDRCHAYIQAGDRDGLARHSVERFREANPHAVPLTLQVARGIQDAFWSNREGAPEPERLA